MQSQGQNISLLKLQKNSSWKGSQQRAKCIGDQESMFLCVNQNCTQKVLFTCSNHTCKCQWLHSQCISAKLSWINNTIIQKIQDTTDIKAFIQQSTDKIIDSISEFRDELLCKIERQLKYYKMCESQINFMDCYYSKLSVTSFNSHDSSILWQILKDREQHQRNVFNQIKNQIKKLQLNVQDNIQNIILSIQDYMSTDQDQDSQQQNQLIQKLKTQLMTKSSICKNQELSLRLLNYFPINQIISIQLIFKASQNDFNVEKFYQSYSRTPNILLLCLSDKDKIVGGYTPLRLYPDIRTFRHQSDVRDHQKQDQDKLSFMFSLTNDHKFNLIRKNRAIYRSGQQKFIQFGNQEIVILDKSNINLECVLNCNNGSYQNYNYQRNDLKSFKKFNGNQTSKCAINQWEVWRIVFQSDSSYYRKQQIKISPRRVQRSQVIQKAVVIQREMNQEDRNYLVNVEKPQYSNRQRVERQEGTRQRGQRVDRGQRNDRGRGAEYHNNRRVIQYYGQNGDRRRPNEESRPTRNNNGRRGENRRGRDQKNQQKKQQKQ